MKVLLVDVNCKYSSTGKIVYDLFTELNRNGHEAAICFGRGPLIREANIVKFGLNLETYIHALLTRLTGLTGVYSPFSTARLIKYIDSFKPDVVHIHELHAYFVNLAPLVKYLKANKIKTVWTFHCEFMYTGKCGHADECEKWKIECGKCPQVREYPASMFFDFTRKMFKEKKSLFEGFDNLVIVTPSKWLAERVRQSFLKDKEIKVIPNGIDTGIFYPRNFQFLKEKHNLRDEMVVLAAAPNLMDQRKGGNIVVALAKRFKNKNIKFIMIGINDTKLQFDDNIIPITRISNQEELAAYYSMADVFLICSRNENLPSTCIEALSCGCRIIGFDVGGTKETTPAWCGYFFEYEDIDSLQIAIDQTSQQEITKQTNADCVEFTHRYHSKEAMYKEYSRLYESML